MALQTSFQKIRCWLFVRPLNKGGGTIWKWICISQKIKKIFFIHDEKLDRTTNGTGFVWDQTLDELRKLDAGQGERIPTLAEVVDLVRSTPVRLCVEIEYEIELDYTDRYLKESLATTEAVINFMDRAGFTDRAVLTSFSPIILQRAKELEPRFPLVIDPFPQDGSLTPK